MNGTENLSPHELLMKIQGMKVSLRIVKYLDVSSKKLRETVVIGMITSNEIKKELTTHIFKFLNI